MLMRWLVSATLRKISPRLITVGRPCKRITASAPTYYASMDVMLCIDLLNFSDSFAGSLLEDVKTLGEWNNRQPRPRIFKRAEVERYVAPFTPPYL